MKNPFAAAAAASAPAQEVVRESAHDRILRETQETEDLFELKKILTKRKTAPEFLEARARRVVAFEPLTFDIESKAGPSDKPGFVRPFLVGLFDGSGPDGGTFVSFRNDPAVESLPWRRRHIAPGGCVDKLMTVLLTEHQGRTVYAHNAGGFDLLFLFGWLRRHPEYKFEIVPVQSSILRVSVWRKDSKSPKKEAVTFLDSMRLFPKSLDDFCKSFGVEGKDYLGLTPKELLHLPESDVRWSAYLEQDCRGLFEALVKLYELVSKLGGDLATTTPATAMLLFRQRFLPEAENPRIERHAHFVHCKNRERCRGCLHAWIRKGYKGGRVEILTMTGKHLHYYDINSSYPTALLKPMPVGSKIEENGVANLDRRKTHVGFIECDVFIPPTCMIPPLPVDRAGKLIFPTGKFSGVWDAEELALLAHPLVGGKILTARKAVWYKAEAIFEPMIRKLYAYRQRCAVCSPTKAATCSACGYDAGLAELAKLLMNSFYGKFGMDPDREKIVMLEPGVVVRGSKPAWHAGDPDSSLSSEIFYVPEKADADYIVPQIASHVTALGRVRLWEEMAHVTEIGGQLFYVDTDAELTDAFVESSPDLGRMKDEFPGKLLTFRSLQPKGYMVEIEGDGRVSSCPEKSCSYKKTGMKVCPKHPLVPERMIKFKGLPKAQRTLENFDKMATGQTVGYRRLGKVRSLAQGDFWGPPTMQAVTKSVKSAYDKRVVLPDGTTVPLVLDGTRVVARDYFN